MVLKDEQGSQNQRPSSFPPSALILESPVRSASNISFKSEENNLEKEMSNTMQIQIQEVDMRQLTNQNIEAEMQQQNNNIDELEVTKETSKMESEDEEKSEKSSISSLNKNETAQLMTITNSPNVSPKSRAVISGSVTLMKPFESGKISHKKLIDENDENEKFDYGGCFPKVLAAVWSTLFD